MQWFFIIGSAVVLVSALAFMVVAFVASLRTGKVNAIHTFVFFAVSMLILALLLFEWSFASGHTSQNTASTTTAPFKDTLSQWLVAIGTIALAAVTVAVSIVIPWWRRPRLRIEFDNKEPYCRKDPPNQGQIYWLRVKVTNYGETVAKNCIGRLVQFREKSGKPVETHDPVKLHWINTLWSTQELFPPIDLGRHEHNFLDLLATRPGYDRALLFMSHDNIFSENPDQTPMGTFQIQVTVYGDNVDPCTKKYSIDWRDKSKYTTIELIETK